MNNKMFCYQCQETAGCKGCTVRGVCGKTPELAAMQDVLIYVTKGLACVTTKLRTQKENISSEVNYLITLNLFTTITNANFDRDVIVNRIKETLKVKNELIKKVSDRDSLPEAALWYAESEEEFENKALAASVLVTENEDIRSLRELIIYGLKGLSAYSKHANALFKEDEELDAFLQSTLAKTLDDSMSVEELTALAVETGKYGVR